MIYAHVDNSIVREIKVTDMDIKDIFHPDMVWLEVDETVKVGDFYNDGVFLTPQVTSTTPTKEEMENLRLIAYSNPISGCDRYFSEALSLQAEGYATNSTEVKEAKAKGISRKTEIQLMYPYPTEK